MLLLITLFPLSRKQNVLFLIVTLPARDNQKLSKILSNKSERSVYGNEYKTISENENTTNNYIYFLESRFAGVSRFFG